MHNQNRNQVKRYVDYYILNSHINLDKIQIQSIPIKTYATIEKKE